MPDTATAQPDDDFQSQTGDTNIALNGLPDLNNSSPRRAPFPETILPEMEPNEQSSKMASSPCAVAAPPAEEEEEEEGNVFRMFRSKNNNTLLDALCDSLIKEGVTKKFASKNFDENEKKSGTIPCPKCDSTFSKLRYLKDHIKRKHDVYECPVCGDKSFNSHVGVEKHMRRAHNMHGEYLKKAMNVRELYREPVASVKEDSLDASQDDGETCEVNDSVNVANGTPGHCEDDTPPVVTATSEQSSEEQDLCDDNLNSSVEVGKRKLKGTGGTILCPHCPAIFSEQRNLNDHIKHKHLTFMCPICGEDNFVSQKGVERHMSRVHSEESSLPVGNACLDQLYLTTNISHNSDSGSLADSSHEHSDASYQDVPAELAWGNFAETSSRRRKSKPFPISLRSAIPLLSQINAEVLHDSSDEWAGEPKKQKKRGMGTIPCPHPECTSTFSEYRYLKDHLRRKHVRIECTVCGDTNFYSYKGLQRHMQTLHSQSDISPLVQQSNKTNLCNSKDVIQSVPRPLNGNSQPDEVAIIIPDDPEGRQTLKPTSNSKGNKIPEDTQDENKLQGNRRQGRRKLSTPVGRGKRKSEAQKSPDVHIEKESQGESIEINGTSEPRKKKRKRQSGDSEEEYRATPNTKKKGSNKKAAASEKKKPVVEVMKPQQEESVAEESDEEWQTVESKKQKRKKSRGNGTIPCSRCDSTFSKARYLRDHIKRKHDISVCPICGDKNFYSQRGVDRHIQTVHGGHIQK